MESPNRDHDVIQWVRMCSLEVALICSGSGSDFSLSLVWECGGANEVFDETSPACMLCTTSSR